MTTTEIIENYPGFPQGITGDELSRLMEEQAKRFGMEVLQQEVVEVKLEGDMKLVQTMNQPTAVKPLSSVQAPNIGNWEFLGRRNLLGKGSLIVPLVTALSLKTAKSLSWGEGILLLLRPSFSQSLPRS